MAEENHMKSIEEEIIYVKHLIKKTNNKIKKLQKNCYLTCDDIIADNNNNHQNMILIKTNGNTKPNIEIIEDENVENIDENFGINFNLNLNNVKNSLFNYFEVRYIKIFFSFFSKIIDIYSLLIKIKFSNII